MTTIASKTEIKDDENSSFNSNVNDAISTENQSDANKLEIYQNHIHKLEQRIDKLVSLLNRAVIENKRRNEIIKYFKRNLFGKIGNTSESKILHKLNKLQRLDEQNQNQMKQGVLFPTDDNIFNEIENSFNEIKNEGAVPELNLPNQDNNNNTDKKLTKGSKGKKKNKDKNKNLNNFISMNGAALEKLGLDIVDEFINNGNKSAECPKCGTKMEQIGRELVSTTLEFVPAHYYIKKLWKITYKCASCKKQGKSGIVRPQSPEVLLPHSVVSASLLSHILNQHFEFGMPLYRQELQIIDSGIPLTRKVLSDWCAKVYLNQVSPLVELLKQELLKNKYIHADETPIEIIKVKGSPGPKQCYMWVYSTTKWNPQMIVYYNFKPGRKSAYAKEFLNGFTGKLHVDGYGGYESLANENSDIVLCSCLTHTRRNFVGALAVNTDNSEKQIIVRLISLLDDIFRFERNFNDQMLGIRNPEKVRQMRIDNEKPVLEKFFEICQRVKDSNLILPKSKLSRAINYALKRKDSTMTFLNDGNCDSNNNTAENNIRPFVIYRKNSLFNFTEAGAEISAGWFTIIQTAKANELCPGRYLKWLLSEIPSIRPMSNLENLRRLLPWSPDVPDDCFARDLEDLRIPPATIE
ncbi:MAG: IS66 family transposase [Succinivibrionaceae bacterium]|nr:IS66 family transposase [Succinivibrionaceae bacterium]